VVYTFGLAASDSVGLDAGTIGQAAGTLVGRRTRSRAACAADAVEGSTLQTAFQFAQLDAGPVRETASAGCGLLTGCWRTWRIVAIVNASTL
jgi:hypothetical protein